MDRIRQPDGNTCGVATIAMVAGVDLRCVKEVMHWKRGGHDYASLVMMLGALHYFGVPCDRRLKRGRSKLEFLPFDAIINFDPEEGEDFSESHWAVWDADARKLLDPDRGCRKPGGWSASDWAGYRYRYLKFERRKRLRQGKKGR